MSNTFQNFWIVAPTAILDTPLPVVSFEKRNEEGFVIDGEYLSINEYLAERGHTTPRQNNDGTKFVKGFPFSYTGIKDVEAKIGGFGLEIGTDVLILNQDEVQEELAKDEWNTAEE